MNVALARLTHRASGWYGHSRVFADLPAAERRRPLLGRARVDKRYAMDRVVEAHADLFARLATSQPVPAPSRLRFGGRFLGARGADVHRVLRRLWT